MGHVRKGAMHPEAVQPEEGQTVGDERYENYLHTSGNFVELKEEFARREKEGWSLWTTEPIGDEGVLLRFRRTAEWATEDPLPAS